MTQQKIITKTVTNLDRESLAIHGGKPQRSNWLPYGRQSISESDIQSVVQCLKSDWLTQGPAIVEFETGVARFTDTTFGIALNSATSALHAAYFAAGVDQSSEIITTAMTFAATANAALYLGATPRFADINERTGNIDVASIESLINKNTKAIVGIDFGGQPCDIDALQTLAKKHNLVLIIDAAHSLGATYKGKPVGSHADMTVFSFHPVKGITSGEGGMIVTNSADLDHKIRVFRTHGIEKDKQFLESPSPGPWYYEQQLLGYNYRITDIQAALGASQMKSLGSFIKRRRQIAESYRNAFSNLQVIKCLEEKTDVQSAYHLFPVLVDRLPFASNRALAVEAFHAENIGVQVHYIPVYQHPLYKRILKYNCAETCPNTENFYNRVLSLPIFPAMTDADVNDVIQATIKIDSWLANH